MPRKRETYYVHTFNNRDFVLGRTMLWRSSHGSALCGWLAYIFKLVVAGVAVSLALGTLYIQLVVFSPLLDIITMLQRSYGPLFCFKYHH